MTAQTQFTEDLATLYERDYHQWLLETTRLLKNKEFALLDLENLIEEIASLGKSEKRAITSNLIVVMLHLLKWRYQPHKRSNSWKSSIREHRRRIQRLITDSPSLKNYLSQMQADCYLAAKKQASDETGLSLLVFPEESPFSFAECLDEDFLA